MTYSSYSEITLPEISLIAGTDATLIFNAHTDSGGDLVVTGSTVQWLLSPYGQPSVSTLVKSGSLASTTAFQVLLADTDTLALAGGKYTYQLVITDSAGKVYRPCQGDLIIVEAIASS